MLPKLKKRITGFLLSEEGRMPKQSLLTLGSFLSVAVIGGVIASKETAANHTNDISISYGGNQASGQHSHHASHGSHSSHSSHTSHSSHSSHASGTTATTATTGGDDGAY